MSDHEDEHTIAEDIVVTKYKMAGDIVNSEYGKRLCWSDVNNSVFRVRLS